MSWLTIFDTTNPPNKPPASWAAVAGYRGSSVWKTMSIAEVAIYHAAGRGVAAMFEATGNEPVTNPSAGTAHARAARKAWGAAGYPAHCSIAYAVDRNITMAQAKGPVARYFELVKAADTALPIAYIENDGGEWLAERGLIAGSFIPAAWSWGSPEQLATPVNPPKHALWLQEHNGVSVAGASSDIGHILSTAPIWWPAATPTPSNPSGDEMTAADLAKIQDMINTAVAKVGNVVAHSAQFAPQLDAAGKAISPTVYTQTLSGRLDQILELVTAK